MKILRTIGCTVLIAFLLFTPKLLVENAQREFTDQRFVRDTDRYRGTIVLYHIVRQRPYIGSLTAWLNKRAEAYEKKHRGTYIVVEGMDEASFRERLEYGRRADAYSFFSGSLYGDLLQPFTPHEVPLREGLFCTDRCVPYCYSGVCLLRKNPSGTGGKRYYSDDVTAARLHASVNEATEEQADLLYTDLRRAGDLIRYKDGFSLGELLAVDSFTDSVCWLGIDRDTDEKKAEVIAAFFDWLRAEDTQKTLDSLGLLSVRADVKSEPPDTQLKEIFRTYASVQTVDPFRWYAEYDTLREDAILARSGDTDADRRFTNRLQELIG